MENLIWSSDDVNSIGLCIQKNMELKRIEVGIASENEEFFYLIYSCPFDKEDNASYFMSCFSEVFYKSCIEEKDKIFLSEIYKKMGMM